ncbi:MAG: putative transporter small subunit [Janibacter sp.]
MSITALTVYILIWPVIVAVILGVICTTFIKELRSSQKKGRDII